MTLCSSVLRLALVPLFTLVAEAHGWRTGYAALAVAVVAIVPLAVYVLGPRRSLAVVQSNNNNNNKRPDDRPPADHLADRPDHPDHPAGCPADRPALVDGTAALGKIDRQGTVHDSSTYSAADSPRPEDGDGQSTPTDRTCSGCAGAACGDCAGAAGADRAGAASCQRHTEAGTAAQAGVVEASTAAEGEGEGVGLTLRQKLSVVFGSRVNWIITLAFVICGITTTGFMVGGSVGLPPTHAHPCVFFAVMCARQRKL